MVEPATLLAFTFLNMSLALVPGPDVICILSNSLSRGGRAGVLVCAGIATACLFHVSCAALGLTAVLATVPAAFTVVKTLGAAYLVWLGWRMIRSPASPSRAVERRRLASPFAQGALANLLNPKIAIFFLAVVPQFIVTGEGAHETQMLLLGLVSVTSGTVVNLVTAALAGRSRRFLLERETLMRRFQQTCGAALIALGLRFAMERAR